MKLVRIEEITVSENRIRKSMEDSGLKALADSILSTHLDNPITVAVNDRLEYELVAGERRMESIKRFIDREYYHGETRIPPGFVPVIEVKDLSRDQLLELEIEENARRIDIPWQDMARARERLHRMRIETNPDWTMADTADNLGIHVSRTSEWVNIGRFLDDSEVSKAPSKAEAVRIIRKKLERDLAQRLSERIRGKEKKEEKAEETKKEIPLSNEDFFSASIAGTFDCFIVDPPYGIEADSHNNFNSVLKHRYSDSSVEFASLLDSTFKRITALANPTRGAHLYWFCSPTNFEQVATALSVEWAVWAYPLIWNKLKNMGAPDASRGPARQYEMILFANRGSRPTKEFGTDVLSHASPLGKIHPAQKPVELIRALLRRSCLAGDRVLSPFCGSGTDILAAWGENLQVEGYESSQEMFNQAWVRLTFGGEES
jgi:site-specific DNA-methyltransferase (adenine-specific)